MSLLNHAQVKRYLLDRSQQRAHKFTRISAESLTWLESKMMTECDKLVMAQPSCGKTVYPPIRKGTE